jgi:hypothetical protein
MESFLIVLILILIVSSVYFFMKFSNLKKQNIDLDNDYNKCKIELNSVLSSFELLEETDVKNQQMITNFQKQLDHLESLKEFKDKYDIAYKQIQSMYEDNDELLVVIDKLSDNFEELKNYSFEVYNSSREMYMFLLEKLKKGFLEDNEDVHELANQIKTFILQGQTIQEKYDNLFLEEEGIIVETDYNTQNKTIDFFEDVEQYDEDQKYYSDEEEVEYFDYDDGDEDEDEYDDDYEDYYEDEKKSDYKIVKPLNTENIISDEPNYPIQRKQELKSKI